MLETVFQEPEVAANSKTGNTLKPQLSKDGAVTRTQIRRRAFQPAYIVDGYIIRGAAFDAAKPSYDLGDVLSDVADDSKVTSAELKRLQKAVANAEPAGYELEPFNDVGYPVLVSLAEFKKAKKTSGLFFEYEDYFGVLLADGTLKIGCMKYKLKDWANANGPDGSWWLDRGGVHPSDRDVLLPILQERLAEFQAANPASTAPRKRAKKVA